jgi:L,D-peptidoglycan transpeptidase YkuD (ErfK/YbiS/YcfS/YnhG family)
MTNLKVQAIRARDGWCDDARDRNYNRPVTHPYPASAERMWREDHLYDLVVVLGYNDVPRRRGRGSAIFMHLARDDYRPTEGCIALAPQHMRFVLSRVRHGSRVRIG